MLRKLRRKLAVSPESAVRLGSAKVVTRPSVSARSSEDTMSRPNKLPTPESVVPIGLRMILPASLSSSSVLPGEGSQMP